MLAAGVVLVGTLAPVPDAGAEHAGVERPSIVFVLTDDLMYDDLAVMPHVRSLILDAGASFERFFVNVSLCCPSRVTMLRGQYAHNTGIETNGDTGGNGGFAAVQRLGLDRDTVATRLRAEGYRTALFGKYLNGYPGTAGPEYVPPGWSRWASPTAGSPYVQYDYVLNENGVSRAYGSDVESYGTTVITRLTEDLIRDSVRDGRPFFALASYFAPHEPATPAPGDAGRFAGVSAPRTASFDQPASPTMPSHLRVLPRLGPTEIASIDALYARRLESLQAVDRSVARLVAVLREVGALDETYLVFSSDNGYHLGQHRLPAGKQTPYDTDTHVPLLVRGPGVSRGRLVETLASNVDLLPTFLDMAGARVPVRVDGRSLLGATTGADVPPARARRAVLLEHWNERPVPTPVAVRTPGDRAPSAPAAPSEPPDLDQRHLTPAPVVSAVALDAPGVIPDYSGLRTTRWIYVEYVTGDRELYDVQEDPDQVHNLAGTRPDVESRFAARLAALRACRAAECRRADGGTVRAA